MAFLWHMHQPSYENPFTGEVELPWVRLHGLKDYFGMVNLLEDFPQIKATFNLVPSLLVQLERYLEGRRDTFQHIFDKEAQALTPPETAFLTRHFFSANYRHLIAPFPRYRHLFQKRENHSAGENIFSVSELRDLQVWFQLCYFDETYRRKDDQIRGLIEKGEHFSEADKTIIRQKEMELLAKIIPAYREFQQTGQIEISTSPFYHPILPLLIDPQEGRRANPALPPYDLHFDWKEDARRQLSSALDYMENRFGQRPQGIWPSEGSLSSRLLSLLDGLGVLWTAGDEITLGRSLSVPITRDRQAAVMEPGVLYRPYRIEGGRCRIFFRDQNLSDLIGFHYQEIPYKDAAADLVERIKSIKNPGNKEWVVPIILDGENAWEYYPHSGRDFLEELFTRISGDDAIETATFSQCLDMETGILKEISPGSWIGGHFDIWIGDEEDRQAWRLLKEARQRVSGNPGLSDRRKEELEKLIFTCEGSDWYWWYGRGNYTPHLDIFDRLFRLNIQKIYRLLGEPVPSEALKPIPPTAGGEESRVVPPKHDISPRIDGEESHYFEWLGAGRIDVFPQGGAMQESNFPVQAVFYGFHRGHLYFRIDTPKPAAAYFDRGCSLHLCIEAGKTRKKIPIDPGNKEVTAAVGTVIEVQLPLSFLQMAEGETFHLRLEWRTEQGILRPIPSQGHFTLAVPSVGDYLKDWIV